MITAYDRPAQQQALPYQAPEPIDAYRGALASMQGRYDKAYLATQQTSQAIANIPVLAQDEPAKQAYANVYKGKLQGIIDSHNGNYAAAANEIDALATWVTSDGHLAAMGHDYAKAQKIQEEYDKDPGKKIKFGNDIFQQTYFNPDGSVNKNRGAVIEDRADRIGAMKDILGNLKPFERQWIGQYADRANFLQNTKISELTKQRIAAFAESNLDNYIRNTPGGGQHYRERTQDWLRAAYKNQNVYLSNVKEGSSMRNLAESKAREEVLRDFVKYGYGFEQHGMDLGLTHDADYAARQKELEEKQSAQFASGTQIALNGDSDSSLHALSPDDLTNMLSGEQWQTFADRRAGGGKAMSYLGQVGSSALNVLPSVREGFAKEREGFAKIATNGVTQDFDANDAKRAHIQSVALANASKIWGKDGAAVAQKLADRWKPGGENLLKVLTPDEARAFSKFYTKNQDALPINKYQSGNIKVLSPNDVKIPGYEPGEKSYTFAVTGSPNGELSAANDSTPLIDESGHTTTMGAVKAAIKDDDKEGFKSAKVAVTGFVVPNSGRLLAAKWNKQTDRFVKLNVGGHSYFSYAPDQQVTRTTVKGRQTGTNIENLGQLSGYQAQLLKGYKDFMHTSQDMGWSDMGYEPEKRSGRLPVQLQDGSGWRAGYQMQPAIIDPTTGVQRARVKVRLQSPDGRLIDGGTHEVDNFFDQVDRSDPAFQNIQNPEVTNGEMFTHGLILNLLSGKK